ncbi:MAG: hypothetical protein KME64_04170 [Scytonematopsis contorta HA4267-MV1]|jgi:hypothetical protein|nr:hypothetical protein [Scytonematopsis contorta HA4267-MV1]
MERVLGMLDFQKSMYEGHPEYAIFAVKAPIEKVTQALSEYQPNTEFKHNIQNAGQICNIISEQKQYWMPIVQPKNNDWAVVYWAIGCWKDVRNICQQISLTRQTKVIEFSEEDTSGAIGYYLFERGKQIEKLDWAPGFELVFESEMREEPEFDNFDEAESDVVGHFINDIFIEEGIYIPAWYLSVADPCLGRVDWMRRE